VLMNITLSLNEEKSREQETNDEVIFFLGNLCSFDQDALIRNEKDRSAVKEYRMRRLCDRIQLAICHLLSGSHSGSNASKPVNKNIERLVHLYGQCLALVSQQFQMESLCFAAHHCTGTLFLFVYSFVYLCMCLVFYCILLKCISVLLLV
jgi:hypothetical protein